jgi:hypothetical protein
MLAIPVFTRLSAEISLPFSSVFQLTSWEYSIPILDYTSYTMYTLFLRLVILINYTSHVIAHDLTSSSASPTQSPVQISNDGTCGNGLTCAGSVYGQCCSQHGFCGNGDAYCGAGCQAELGSCGNLAPTTSSSSIAPGPQTVTLTKTVTAFVSGLYTTTTTITGAVTRTFFTTATNVVSRTEVRVCFDRRIPSLVWTRC